MIEKLRTALWFAQRPNCWAHARNLASRKFRTNYDTQQHAARAYKWANQQAVSVPEALAAVGLFATSAQDLSPPPGLLAEGSRRAQGSAVRMGGAADVNLLYAIVVLSQARRVIETGVAYGWSSLAILAALGRRPDAVLISVDMPYPKMKNERFVGIVVPEALRGPWTILHEPDRHGIEKAVLQAGAPIDVTHYDSDKSWWGRQYAYPLLWRALRPAGIFISDDIQDNMAFAEFVAARKPVFAVTELEGKYVGIARKL
jgi:predicted O-methyltransferase YrrM